MRLRKDTELGLEITCSICFDYWPADKEFYNILSDGRFHSSCRACCTQRKRELRAGFPRKIKRKV